MKEFASLPSAEVIRVAVIGVGVRSVSYLTNVPSHIRDRIHLVAVADISAERRKLFAERFTEWGRPEEFEDGNDLLKNASYDALIIGSYNNTHADFAIEALSSGACILLEKPVAISIDQCRRLWQKFQSVEDARVFVGFVLRYSPFYKRVDELIKSKAVGQLLAIDADENLSQSITSGFFRDWRRDDKLSGGFMVEKCSHDFDIFHMLTGKMVSQVFSIARRTHFVSRPREEQHRRFDSDVIRNIAFDYSDIHVKQIFENTSDESIYDAVSDVPDHQAVMLEYEDGELINFMACHGQPRATRRLRVFGSNGSLEGDIDRGLILQDIPHEDHLGAETKQHEVLFDDSGHHGADSVINDAFWQAAAGEEVKNLAGVREGIEAVLVGIAVEQSKQSGRPVKLEPLRNAVYGNLEAPVFA